MPTKNQSEKSSAGKKVARSVKAAAPKKPTTEKAVAKKPTVSPTRVASNGKLKQTPAAKPKMVKEVLQPTVEMISARAHQIWLSEGCPDGRSEEHWLRAETELRQSH